jgi:hypothetical protein
MSDGRESHHYEALRETQRKVEEEAEKQRTAGGKVNSPEARLAAFEAELAEKLRLGRITKGEMSYQLRRFDNALEVEMNIEKAQQARDEAARADVEPEHGQEEPNERRRSPRRDETEAEAVEQEFAGRGEMTEARAARLARLREITENLARNGRENDGHGLDTDRESGDRSR